MTNKMSMIEKVAFAICKANGEAYYKSEAQNLRAKAAIEAMRDPTEKMSDILEIPFYIYDDFIDEALSEEEVIK